MLLMSKIWKMCVNTGDIKLANSNERREKLVREPNFHACKVFDENFMAFEMRKIEVVMNIPIYLGQAILDICKKIMNYYWYNYLKPKYNDKIKLLYMDTDNFIIDVETDDFYNGISNDVEKWFDTFRYHKTLNRPLETGLNKKALGKVKDEMDGNIITDFVP